MIVTASSFAILIAGGHGAGFFIQFLVEAPLLGMLLLGITLISTGCAIGESSWPKRIGESLVSLVGLLAFLLALVSGRYTWVTCIPCMVISGWHVFLVWLPAPIEG